MRHRKDYFDFMLKQIRRTAADTGDLLPQAFGRWFSRMYFPGFQGVEILDGSGDGKVDLVVTCHVGKQIVYHVLNTKLTEKYDRQAPVSFYDEITRYWQAFKNQANRPAYLNAVREDLRPIFKKLFKHHDDGLANLYFVTNHRRNDNQYLAVQDYEDLAIFHLDDVLHYVAEYLDNAMPETDPLLLTSISNVLQPTHEQNEASDVRTSIVFAKVIDFIKYMDNDRFDLLFARNVRQWRGLSGKEETNRDIYATFRDAPHEFAFSNNGITILCDDHEQLLGKHELLLKNPRVVNGSQTLHSVCAVENPSESARVMVRIIEVPRPNGNASAEQIDKKKEIINKIACRSNQQNPIKRWDLVSNDDFQLELARYFHDKGWYYERQRGQWMKNKPHLIGSGIWRGPDIKWLAQLIAAFHYDKKKLGPAIAHHKLKDLFEEEVYSFIRTTPPTRAYQLYLLGEISDRALRRLAAKKRYVWNVKGYIDLCAFAWLCKILREGHVFFGKEDLNRSFEDQYVQDDSSWEAIVKRVVDLIVGHFKKAKSVAAKREGITLTPANYFKNATLIGEVMAKAVPPDLRKLGQRF